VAGALTVTPVTLRSAAAVMVVVADPAVWPLLLPVLGSETCIWSMAAEAEAVKDLPPSVVQVTEKVAGTVVAVDVGRLVFWTVTGLVEDVVQLAGRFRVRVVSTLVGP
jgi:hypothetical protein